MKRRFILLGFPVILLHVLCACASGGQSYYGSSANGSYYLASTLNNGYQAQSQPQVIYEAPKSYTDTGATGSGFRQEYKQTINRDRERSINDYLRSNGMWGSTVMGARDKLKVSIASADGKLADLRNKIIVAGGTPGTNPNYIAVKEARDRLARKLQDLDKRIMNAIITKATGDAARRLIWRDEDKAEINSAILNLQNAEEQQIKENRELLKRANW